VLRLYRDSEAEPLARCKSSRISPPRSSGIDLVRRQMIKRRIGGRRKQRKGGIENPEFEALSGEIESSSRLAVRSGHSHFLSTTVVFAQRADRPRQPPVAGVGFYLDAKRFSSRFPVPQNITAFTSVADLFAGRTLRARSGVCHCACWMALGPRVPNVAWNGWARAILEKSRAPIRGAPPA